LLLRRRHGARDRGLSPAGVVAGAGRLPTLDVKPSQRSEGCVGGEEGSVELE